MGGVNSSADYVREVEVGLYPSGVVTNVIKQGGIVACACPAPQGAMNNFANISNASTTSELLSDAFSEVGLLTRSEG